MFATVDYDPNEEPEMHSSALPHVGAADRVAAFWGLRPIDEAPSHSVRLFLGECAWDQEPKRSEPSAAVAVVYCPGEAPRSVDYLRSTKGSPYHASGWGHCWGVATTRGATDSVRLFLGETPWELPL